MKNAVCDIEQIDSGLFLLRGELSFSTVMGLSKKSDGLLWQTDAVTLNLGAVTRTDSAGLALLVEWIRRARQQGKVIQFSHIPKQMMAMAEVVGLAKLMPLSPQ